MDIHPPPIPCSRTHSLAHIYLLGSQQGCISEAGSRKLKPSWGASKPKRKAYNKVVLLSDAKMPHKYDLFVQKKTGAGMCGMFKTISSEESYLFSSFPFQHLSTKILESLAVLKSSIRSALWRVGLPFSEEIDRIQWFYDKNMQRCTRKTSLEDQYTTSLEEKEWRQHPKSKIILYQFT